MTVMVMYSISQLWTGYTVESSCITMMPLICCIPFYCIFGTFSFADSICSMKITWYVLILLVCIVLLIFIIRKILEGHRRVQKWQSKY